MGPDRLDRDGLARLVLVRHRWGGSYFLGGSGLFDRFAIQPDPGSVRGAAPPAVADTGLSGGDGSPHGSYRWHCLPGVFDCAGSETSADLCSVRSGFLSVFTDLGDVGGGEICPALCPGDGKEGLKQANECGVE